MDLQNHSTHLSVVIGGERVVEKMAWTDTEKK